MATGSRQGVDIASGDCALSRDLLAGHKRMRASLAAILPLDPRGIAVRIAEMDREIARVGALLDAEPAHKRATTSRTLDTIAIGTAAKAA